MKVAIVRGNNLNPFEMQSYGPIASAHEFTGYASYVNAFELKGIPFSVKKLHTTEEYYRPFPSLFRSLAYGLSLRGGYNQRMFGLEKELADKDIIHTAETYTGYSYQAARLRARSNKKLVLTVWENIPFLSTHQFMGFDGVPVIGEPLRRALTSNDRIVKYVKDHADVLIAVTGPAKAALMAEGVPEDKIRVRPVGIDTERFKPAPPEPDIRKKMGLEDDDFIVLFIGRLEKEKGVYDLLEAARLASADTGMAHVKVAMVGGGAEKDRITRTINAWGLEGRVKLAGPFPYEDVPRLYNASDAFILPSIPVPFWQEQFGMVLVEAMASGLPVISTRTGSIPEVVSNAGILVEPNDPLAIAEGLRRLASDEAYRKTLGAAARERAMETYNVDVVSRGIESVYKELV